MEMRSRLMRAGTLVGVLVSSSVIIASSPVAAAPVDQSTFVREFVAQSERFQEPTARLALETTARLRMVTPDGRDSFDIRMRTLQNPDGSLTASVTGSPSGDLSGVCGATGPCYVTTDGGSTWLTGPRPKKGLPVVDEDFGGYDPFEWGRRDVPVAQAYDVTGRTFTMDIDADSRITFDFARRSATVTGTFEDEGASARVDAERRLVAPRTIRLPR